MMTLENILDFFAQGYAIYFGSYYSNSLIESAEEIQEKWEDAETNEWLYIESTEIDPETKEIRIFVRE